MYERFRPEFKTAVDAWLARGPLDDPSAPPTPFAMKQYQLAADQEAARLERRAEALTETGRTANQRSDDYVLVTIMFASVLFFAGISSKMSTMRERIVLLGSGVAIFVAASIVTLSFPKQF